LIQIAQYLHNWVRKGGFDLKEVFDGFTAAIEGHSQWNAEQKSHWSRIEPVLQFIVESPVVRLSVAANELSFERSRILRTVRIVTDIRPIFNPEVTSIDASLVTHLLRLVFTTSTGKTEDLELALDEGDIEILAAQCDRAREKAVLALAVMNDKAEVPSMLFGEMENE
jgi:NACalpha-BTF3-like transcription factor